MSRQGTSDQGNWGTESGRFGQGQQGGDTSRGGSARGGQYEQRAAMPGQQGGWQQGGARQQGGGQQGRQQQGGGQQRGQFAGRGPRGYRRADDRIGADVCEALTLSPDIDASEVDVIVTDGVVTLIGVVDDRDDKRLAEDLTEQVPGVVDVNNQLRLEGQSQQGDQSRGQISDQSRTPDRPGFQTPGDGGARATSDRGAEQSRAAAGASAGR